MAAVEDVHVNACLPRLEQPHSCTNILHSFTQQWMCLQPFFAPFVLTRPRCTGDEDRLVECPGLQQPAPADPMSRFKGSSVCTSLGFGRQTPDFVVVACGTGMDAEAGTATPSWPAHTASRSPAAHTQRHLSKLSGPACAANGECTKLF